MGYTPHVLVVGGGATGTGIARDLSVRGLDVTLVEQGTLANGTSGSMHALLHSGARYADEDPEIAAACRRESQVLREIGPHLVTETGGLFASLAGDDPAFVETKREACEAAGIETTVLDGATARQREPALAETVERALEVPDAVVDPFRLCAANAISAHEHGAEIRLGARVVAIETVDDAVEAVGLRTERGATDDATTDRLEPDYVVNAAGPLVDAVADRAGLSVPVRHSQGAMLVVDRGGLETVVNRCRPRTEGDIAVPFGPSAVLGTTDRPIEDVGSIERTAAEVDLLVDELGALVPSVAAGAPFRAFWGVRALPPAADAPSTVEVSRQATLVDHEAADGCWGLSSIYGGKLTTHRATAERVADHICGKFGIDRACRTASLDLPAVPPASDAGVHAGTDPILCRSQGVRRSAVRAVLDHDVVALSGDLRPATQLTRAGMGACQGGRCAHRLAVQVDAGGSYPTIDRALREFADDRWAGRRHALWGEGFAGAMATYDFHARTMHRDGRPITGMDTLPWAEYAGGTALDQEDESDA